LNNPSKYSRAVKFLLLTPAILIGVYALVFFYLGGPGRKKVNLHPVLPSGTSMIFAHRGITAGFPENSLESIGEAKKLGFGAVEFDLRKSADGDFILFHDADCRRMLGLDKSIKEITTAGLKNYPLLMNGKKTSFHVPTLEEVMNRHHSDFIFYLDMKLSSFREADQIVEVIHRYGIENTAVVACADILFVFYIEFHHPQIHTALEGYNAGKEWTYNLMPKNLKPDFLSGFLSRVDDNHMRWLKSKDLLSTRIVYGVDSSNYIYARKMGLENLILDYDTVSHVFNNLKLIKH